jgi:hypothetical protein
MSTTNGKPALTPEHYIPLPQLAKLAASKPNVLRKHRVAGWLAAGLAHKDPKGNWWVDPAVLPTVKPVRSAAKAGGGESGVGRVAHSPVPPASSDPSSLEMTMRTASPETAVAGLSPNEVHELLDRVGTAEVCLAAALSNLLELDPIPWDVVLKLAGMGKKASAKGRAK